VTPPTGTKFIVVDSSARDSFNYDAAGNLVAQHGLNDEDEGPRGVTTNKDGSLHWVIDAKGEVFVYGEAGQLLGSWKFTGVDQPEGITTDGRDIWIVDRGADKVLRFAGAASRLSGTARPTASFALVSGNQHPMDVTTDGVHLWVVDDSASVDRVFRYTIGGKLEGNWKIDSANSRPTGLTIDPNDVSNIWIVDAGTDRVYQYDAAATRVSGSQLANSSSALVVANRNPQGIADPLPNVATGKPLRAESSVTRHDEIAIPEVEKAGQTNTVNKTVVVPSVVPSPTTDNGSGMHADDSKRVKANNSPRVKTTGHVHDQALSELMNEFDNLHLADSVESLIGKSNRKR
jgi:hypothetical protein